MDNYTADLPAAGLGRRLAALLYDGFLVLAIWFITAGIVVPLYTHSGLPVDNINGVTRPPLWFRQGVMLPLMLIEAWAFYAWFWLHGGQTLGMRSWSLLVRDYRRRPMSFGQTVGRFLGGMISWFLVGAGYLVVLLPPGQTLHDRLSATETVVVPKERRK